MKEQFVFAESWALEKGERRSMVKRSSTLLSSYHHGVVLLGRGPAPIKSRSVMWGKIDTPIHVFPQLTELLSKRLESILILSHIMTLFCLSIMKD